MRAGVNKGQKLQSLFAEKVASGAWVELLSGWKWDGLGKDIVVVDEIANHTRSELTHHQDRKPKTEQVFESCE